MTFNPYRHIGHLAPSIALLAKWHQMRARAYAAEAAANLNMVITYAYPFGGRAHAYWVRRSATASWQDKADLARFHYEAADVLRDLIL